MEIDEKTTKEESSVEEARKKVQNVLRGLCPCGSVPRSKLDAVCWDCYELDKLSKAKEKINWQNTIYVSEKLPRPSGSSINGDGYYADIDEYQRCCDDYQIEPAEFAFCTDQVKFHLNVDDILEQALEEHYEDAYDALIDVRELESFISYWLNKQVLTTYYPDFQHKVKIR